MNKAIKSLAITLMAGAMAVSAVGCSSSNNKKDNKDSSSVILKNYEDIKIEPTDNKDAPLGETIIKEVDDGENELESLKAVAKSDDIMISFELEDTMSMTLAKKGSNIYTNTSFFGITSSTLSVDGQVYLLDNENKVYCIGSEEDLAGMDTEELGMDEAFIGEFLGAWDVEIDGGTFKKLKIKTEDGSISCLYLYDGELKYIIGFTEDDNSDSEETESKDDTDDTDTDDSFYVMKVTAYTTTDIDDSYFQLPADYKEVTADEYYELMYGDLDFGLDDEASDDIAE